MSEIKLRLGKNGRLECAFAKGLTEQQVERRRALIKELAADIRRLEDTKGQAVTLLTKLAHAPNSEEAGKMEKAIRRFISEPKKVSPVAAKSVTFKEFAIKWGSGELHKEYPRKVRFRGEQTINVDMCRVRKLNELIGDIPLVDFTEADAERALDHLPDDAESSSTIRHYAQVIQTVIRRAISPGNIIHPTKYPLRIDFLPPLGTPPMFPILYPNDVRMLLGCRKIELWKRMLYAFAIYEGMRISHILRLRWSNVDFENGMITVGIGKNNKNARTWEMNNGTGAALKLFRDGAPGGDFIFPRLTKNEILKLSEELREDLMRAGVTREVHPDLFAKGDGQCPVRFQDLRATFVSLHLAMGWTEVDVMLRTQHTSTKVLHHHYARRLGVAKAIVKKQGGIPPMGAALGLLGGGKGGGKSRVAA